MSDGPWSAPGEGSAPPPPPPPAPGTISFSNPGWQPPKPKAGSHRTGPLPLHPMTLSDILDGAFKLFKANARTVLTITAVITVPIQILGSLLTVSSGFSSGGSFASNPGEIEAQSSSGDPAAIAGFAIFGLASLLVIPFVTGAISRVVAASYLGQQLPPGLALRATFRRFPALLWAWCLVHLAEGSLFIVAGLLAVVAIASGNAVLGVTAAVIASLLGVAVALGAMALFQATAPAIVVEEIGPVKGMRRSWRLMRPRFWGVLGVAVLSGLMASVLGNIVGAIPSGIGLLLPRQIRWIAIAAGGTLTSLLTTPFIAIVATLVYFDGRIRHEGFDLEIMASDLARAPIDR